jgi:hypothetical protein
MAMLALKFYPECGFGGIRDRFDLIIPPDKIANILTGSIELVPITVLKE